MREVSLGVVAGIAKLSVGREDYYVREVGENREEYLSGHGESPGRWLGRGAAALSQEGVASTEAFVRMFHGRHPDTGEVLGRPHGEHGVPAFDVVLRPTKSVSLLYGLGDARTAATVLEAHHQATSEATAILHQAFEPSPPLLKAWSNGPNRSSGSGKKVVVDRSEAISRMVCRYRSWTAIGCRVRTSAASDSLAAA